MFEQEFLGHWKPEDDLPPDDPLQCRKVKRATTKALKKFNKKMSKVMRARFDDNLWESEDVKKEEIPEELKESGAIMVKLRDVRNSIGKDRADWKNNTRRGI